MICARGYATIWPAGYDEPCLLDGAAIRLLASAMATVRAYENIEARRGRDGGDVRDVRCCRDVRSWAEVCAAAREREFKILARDSVRAAAARAAARAAAARAAAEAAAEVAEAAKEEEPETGSGEAAALAAPLRGLASAPGCAGTTDRVTSFFDTLRPACNATTASSSSSSSTSIAGAAAGEAAAAAPALTKSARKRLKEKARKGRRAAEAAGEPEVAPSPAPPPVFKTLREKKAAQASAEGWAAEVARAEELYEELRERAPQHCRRGGKWAREKFVMAVQGEFPRARGAGVPKGTGSCASAGCSTRTMCRMTRWVGTGTGRRTRSGSTPTRCCSAPCACMAFE